MDFQRPISSILPGASGRLVETLARSSEELNLTRLAELAGISGAQASRVLRRFVDLGLVTRKDVPPSALFALNRDHIAIPGFEALLATPKSLEAKLRELATAMRPAPVNVTLFGSAARGDATASSDLDVLIVRPANVPPDDLAWTDATADLTLDVRAASGNHVSVLEVGEDEVPTLLRSRTPVWRSVADEGVTICGPPLSGLAKR